MKIITFDQIKKRNITSKMWYEWVEYVLKNKHKYIMPAKISLHFDSSYFNTMPSIMKDEGIMGVKVVNRYLGRTPSLDSQILLYDYYTGNNIAMMDANYITAMRTGAVTVHSVELFALSDFYEIGIMGFGNIGVACLKILLDHYSERPMKIKLLKYKDHAEKIIERFGSYKNVQFIIVNSYKEVIENSDVIISCISYTDELLAKDEWFKRGCLVIPVHLRGFQNCDLFFDKIYGDDYNQVKGFKYFNNFKYFAETSEVLRGEKIGRSNNNERILVYNVGMSLHDVYAAGQIYKIIKDEVMNIDNIGPNERYWL